MTVLDRSYLLGGFRTLKNGEDIKRTLRAAYDTEGTLDAKEAQGRKGNGVRKNRDGIVTVTVQNRSITAYKAFS